MLISTTSAMIWGKPNRLILPPTNRCSSYITHLLMSSMMLASNLLLFLHPRIRNLESSSMEFDRLVVVFLFSLCERFYPSMNFWCLKRLMIDVLICCLMALVIDGLFSLVEYYPATRSSWRCLLIGVLSLLLQSCVLLEFLWGSQDFLVKNWWLKPPWPGDEPSQHMVWIDYTTCPKVLSKWGLMLGGLDSVTSDDAVLQLPNNIVSIISASEATRQHPSHKDRSDAIVRRIGSLCDYRFQTGKICTSWIISTTSTHVISCSGSIWDGLQCNRWIASNLFREKCIYSQELRAIKKIL